MSKSQKSMQDHVNDAKAKGVTDAYEFAEYLVDEVQHYGDFSRLDTSEANTDLESAWVEAQNQWEHLS